MQFRSRRFAACLATGALVLAPLPASAAPGDPAPRADAVPACTPTTYAHDADGRLTAVFDATGAGRRYAYDANGNITAVVAMPAGTLAAAQVSVPTARRGADVQIFGTGFDPATTVTFNEVAAAAPTAVTANSLHVTVPPTATTGPLVLARGGTTAAAGTFTVDTTPAPTITGVTPAVVDPGGTLTVAGSGFAAAPAGNTVRIGGTQAVVTAASAASLTVQAPPLRATGRVTVRTGAGLATSAAPVTTAPFPYIAADVGWTGLLAAGTTTAVTTAANKIGVGALPVAAGTPFTVAVPTTAYAGCVDVRVLTPAGRPAWREDCANAGATSPPITSPVPATYVVQVDAHGPAGSLTLRPATAPTPAAASTTVGAPRPRPQRGSSPV